VRAIEINSIKNKEQSEKNTGTDQMDLQPPATEPAESTSKTDKVLTAEELEAKKRKKEEKKRIKEEERREHWKKKRKDEKARKKQSRKRKIEELKEQGIDPTTQLKKRRKKEEIAFDPQRIAIDLDFEAQMSDKDIRKLANQLRNGYGSNMKQEHPLTLFFTSFKGKVAADVAKNEGWEHWSVQRREEPWWQVFDLSAVVYLSSEGETELATLDPSKVYIIGGLVDHNQHKGLTHRLATERGVVTARLPIDKYLTLDSRKVLTVNQGTLQCLTRVICALGACLLTRSSV
jgi:tRNA (guanine9-N1)-methyltransferase